jgi:hypothetical protein
VVLERKTLNGYTQCGSIVDRNLNDTHAKSGQSGRINAMHDEDKREILAAIASARLASHEQAKKTRVLIRERFDHVASFGTVLTAILAELERITTPVIHKVTVVVSGQSIHIPGLQQENDMYTVARDHANEPFTLDPITASDSEGPVTVEFTERLESSDDSIVAVVGSEFSFGTFGGATVNRIVTFDGNDFIIASAVFNVTPGAISFTGNINMPGLTPDAE